MTGAKAIIESLLKEDVEVVFGYPGGAIMPVYDALYDKKEELDHVLTRHEQGAIHAAQGYALSSGKPGVCFSTSGPGATNLVTGIADAMLDSVPVVCITGQVTSGVIGTDAFQEVDVIGLTTPITKWNYQVTRAEEIPEALAKAFHLATTGRPGPVVIDLTKDAQFAEFDFKYPEKVQMESFNPNFTPNEKQIKRAADLINKAEKPYMIIGHGVLISEAEEEVKKLAKKADIPIASTLLGLSAVETDNEKYVGWVGMHGNMGPNVLTNQADVILAVGMRFDDRVTGKLDTYAKQAKVIHIDIDPAELNKNVPAEIPIVADAKQAFAAMLPHIKKQDHKKWFAEFKKYEKEEKEKVTDREIKEDKEIRMAEVVDMVSSLTQGEAIVVADVGQNQMKSARYYKFKNPRSYITSGGAGTMGYALPASIGAKKASPEREVLCIVGDGGIQMTIQELATISQEGLNIKIIVLNNGYLGMVRQWQELFFDRRYSFTQLENPDFVQVAKGFGIESKRVSKPENLKENLDMMLNHKGPYLLEVVVEQEENVFPMIPSGASVDEVRLE